VLADARNLEMTLLLREAIREQLGALPVAENVVIG